MPFPCTTNLSLNGKHILKKSNLVKNVKNLKNTMKGILWFYDNTPDNKPEDPTEIFHEDYLFHSFPERQLINFLQDQ